MNGKIIQVKENTLKGSGGSFSIIVYCCFKNLKYGDNYIIYGRREEYHNNVLYYGTVHFNPNSIIVLDSKKDVEKDILFVVDCIINNKPLTGFEFLPINNVLNTNIVSKNQLELKESELIKLDEKSILREQENVKKEEKKSNIHFFKYFIIVIFILGGVGIYFYVSNRPPYYLECIKETNDNKVSANVKYVMNTYFDKNNEMKYLKEDVEYIFYSKIEYNEFKNDSNLQKNVNVSYDKIEYDDKNKTVIYKTKKSNLTNDYDTLNDNYITKGYACEKVENNEKLFGIF